MVWHMPEALRPELQERRCWWPVPPARVKCGLLTTLPPSSLIPLKQKSVLVDLKSFNVTVTLPMFGCILSSKFQYQVMHKLR